MAPSSWLCTNNTKNMLVKIVHPGGHTELHDQPVLAAEIMLRNPKCCVAYPHVFQQPWAIVAPDTTLMPGQKFYVVPVNTIRKLQHLSLKYSPTESFPAPSSSPSPSRSTKTKELLKSQEDREGSHSNCWFFIIKGPLKAAYASAKNHGCLSKDNCFICLLQTNKLKTSNESASEESASSFGSSETKALTGQIRIRGMARRGHGGSAKRNLSLDPWQPSLESINEEGTGLN